MQELQITSPSTHPITKQSCLGTYVKLINIPLILANTLVLTAARQCEDDFKIGPIELEVEVVEEILDEGGILLLEIILQHCFVEHPENGDDLLDPIAIAILFLLLKFSPSALTNHQKEE